MLKRVLAGMLTVLALGGIVQAQNAADSVTSMVIVTPDLLDLESKDVVIGTNKSFEGDFIRTTVTLTLDQNSKGKLVGVAQINSTRPVDGQPQVSLPIEVPVKGKIKGLSFSLKGKLKVSGGADFHSRNIGLSIFGNLVTSTLDTKTIEIFNKDSQTTETVQVPVSSELNSTAQLECNVQISNLGSAYSFAATIPHKGQQWFGIQTRQDTTGLKPLPANTKYFEVTYPKGFEIIAGNMQVVDGTSVFSFKGKNVRGIFLGFVDNHFRFVPVHVEIKTKTILEILDNPQFFYGPFTIKEPSNN